MNKRQFLSNTTGLLVGTGLFSSPSVKADSAKSSCDASQIILTVVGGIKKVNRGKSDPMKDQLMYTQGVRFERAYTLTFADLEKLPSVSISPTMEYDARVHQLSGPRLIDVLDAVGINKSTSTQLIMRGLDGYSPEISLDRVKECDYIVATRIDDQILSMGGFGPLFALFDPERIEEYAKRPLNQRFVACPWGLYCIEVAG